MDTHGIDLSKDPVTLQRLREACERAKIDLDAHDSTTIDIPFIAQGPTDQPLHIKRVLTKSEYESIVAPLIQRTVAPCRRCMHDAGISTNDIGAVLLVGGHAVRVGEGTLTL